MNPGSGKQESFLSDGNATPMTWSLSTITEIFTALGLLPSTYQISTRLMLIILPTRDPRNGNRTKKVLDTSISNFILSLVCAESGHTKFAIPGSPIHNHF